MVVSQTPKITKVRIIKNIIVISLAFFMLFTAYDGLSMLQSTMNKKGGIGVISQAVSYIAFCISALLLPKYIIRKLGCKSSLVFSIALYLPGIAANLYPTWPLMMSAAILGGIGASILWGSQCTYFNELAFRYAKLITKGMGEKDSSSGIPSLYTRLEKVSAKNYGGCSRRYSFSENHSLDTSVETLSTINYSKRHSLSDIPSLHTSVETLSVGQSMDEENLLKNISSLKDNLEVANSKDSIVRYRSKIHHVVENEIKISQYAKTNSENIHSSPAKEEMNSESVENSSSDHIPHFTDQNHKIKKKEVLESVKISNIENIVKNVGKDVSCRISKDISKLEQSLPKKRLSISKQVFQKADTLESVTSIFFGCHSMAYYSAQIVSNAISYFVLQSDESNINFADDCSCGSQFCNNDSGCIGQDTEIVSNKIRYLLTGISMVVGFVSFLLLIFFVDPLQRENSDEEPEKISLRLISATINHNKKKDQLCLIPLALFEGMQQGFYSADFTKSYVGCAWGASNVGLVSVFFGSACVVSSFVSGFLVKYAGRRALFLLGQIICIFMSVFLLLWNPNAVTPYKFYIAAILFGTTTGIYWSQVLSFYGLLFKEDEEAAFASYYLWDSLGFTASLLYSDYLCTYVKIYILLTVSIIGTIGYLFVEKSYESRKLQLTIMSK